MGMLSSRIVGFDLKSVEFDNQPTVMGSTRSVTRNDDKGYTRRKVQYVVPYCNGLALFWHHPALNIGFPGFPKC
jgi:hypothetical protein